MEKENFKDVIGFENQYKISEFGKVVSKSRIKEIGLGCQYLSKEKILKQSKNNKGYFCVSLSNGGKVTKMQVHQLVAINFLNHKPNGHEKVIDHIDNNKENNHVENLQIISQRENASKDIVRGSSDFIGVYWYKPNKKWTAKILIKNKRYYLGLFESEVEANVFYQTALKEKDFAGVVDNFRVFVKNKIKNELKNL